MKSAFVVLALVAAVSAQTSAIPKCATDCVTGSGCKATDINCLCTNAAAQTKIATCAQSKCSSADLATALSYQATLCANVTGSDSGSSSNSSSNGNSTSSSSSSSVSTGNGTASVSTNTTTVNGTTLTNTTITSANGTTINGTSVNGTLTNVTSSNGTNGTTAGKQGSGADRLAIGSTAVLVAALAALFL